MCWPIDKALESHSSDLKHNDYLGWFRKVVVEGTRNFRLISKWEVNLTSFQKWKIAEETLQSYFCKGHGRRSGTGRNTETDGGSEEGPRTGLLDDSSDTETWMSKDMDLIRGEPNVNWETKRSEPGVSSERTGEEEIFVR